MTAVETGEDFRIGRVVSRLFQTLFGNLGVCLPLGLLLMIPLLLLNLYIALSAPNTGLSPQTALIAGGGGRMVLLIVGQAVLYIIFGYTLQASLTQATITYLNDEQPAFGPSLATGIKYFLPLIALGILSLLGMTLGMVLLIVPGIIVALMWSVVVPALVVEHTGIRDAFGRSRELTRGHRGKIFLLLLMYFVLAVGVGLVIRPLLGVSVLAPNVGQMGVAYMVIEWLSRVVLALISSVGATAIYYELRLVKEGIGAQQMAAAFD